MKPSSSPSDDPFAAVLTAGPVAAAVAGPAWLRAMLDVEVALARVQARAGLIPAEHAAAIAAAIGAAVTAAVTATGVDPAAGVGPATDARPNRGAGGWLDPAAVAEGAAATGNPAEPLVRQLRAAVPAGVAPSVHKGATSQDVVDTAAMLVVREATGLLLADLAAAEARAAELAAVHRHTVLSGRTLLQPASPTTFGLVAAGWMTALHEAARGLRAVRADRLAVQLGGAAGTLAVLGADGPAVADALADELGLARATLPWHTDRVRIAELAGALGAVAGAVAKVARDIVLYSQAELGELSDAVDRGGSSTLPHKRNPVAAVAAAAGAAQAPGLVATLLAAMPHEFQRAAGGWHAEWRPLRALLEAAGSAAHWLRDCLVNLVVHPDRMRSTVDGQVDALLAEPVAAVLTGRGVAGAGQRVREHTGPLAELVGPLDPADHVGAAPELVDRALLARLPAPVPLHHAVGGNGPPVLLLNSLGSDLSMWDGVLPALERRFTVIRCDTRGHGRSPVPSGPYTMDDLGSDVLALLDSLRVGRAHVVGVSLGGLQAMWLGAYAPSRVDRLALVCTAAHFPPPQGWAERAARVRAGGTDSVADAVVGRWFTAPFAAREPDVVAATRAMIAATPSDGYAGCCGALERADLRPVLPAIAAPTLVLSGADDPASPPGRGREIPATRFECVPAAHLAPIEIPDVVAGLLTLFLEDE